MFNQTSKVYADTIPFQPFGRVCALGYFDGLHMGHMEIIRKAVKAAKMEGMPCLVQTFNGFPKGDGRLLTNMEERLEVLSEAGVDEMLVLNFTDEFKATSPEDFCEGTIKTLINARAILVGDDYSYGKMAAGDVNSLKAYGMENDIAVKVIKAKTLPGGDRRISSTWMRQSLDEGDVETYAELTGGRYFSYSGIVVEGKKLGRELGFPTVNVVIPDDKYLARRGVYVSRVTVGNRVFGGVTNIGLRPTVEDAVADLAETYIFDFDEDIYGAKIKVELIKFLRPETKFTSKDELVQAVEANKWQAKTYFDNSGILAK
ncbi:MAG: riboflavin biosynthesis protein RibF [Saccharofermentans sp.]|nr:riboflavin biosynthesis protein RibF [Saccharofermentans sp.]